MLYRAAMIGCFGLGILAAGSGFAQEKKEPGTPPAKAESKDPKKPAGDKPAAADAAGQMSPEQMAAAMQAMMPGPAHQQLAKLAGNWPSKAKLSMPGGPSEEHEGTSKITVVLDGRFIHEDYSGTMMGMPFKSSKVLGYNNGSKKYEGVWAYTLGTSLMTLSGTSDDGGKTIKCTASFDNEIGIKETMNVTYKMIDDDRFNVVLDGGKMPDGSPGPTMELTYTRKK